MKYILIALVLLSSNAIAEETFWDKQERQYQEQRRNNIQEDRYIQEQKRYRQEQRRQQPDFSKVFGDIYVPNPEYGY